MGISDKIVNVTLKAQVVNIQQVGQLEQAINKATVATGKIGPASNTAAAGITKIQGAAVSGNKAINQFGVGTEQANSKLGKFGKIFSDNRGIVFGVAGLTSALAEAVGMMGMFGDSQERLKEAQAELNELEQQGITGGKAHADAVAEVVKQQRFFNMVSRNTILSQMDMVFFTTMVISGLVKMNTEGGAASGMLGKLKGMFTGLTGALSTTTNNFGSFMNAFSPLPTTMGKTQQAAAGVATGINQVGMTSALSTTKILAFTAALAGIGLAAYGIFQLISAAEKLKESLSQVFSEAIMKVSLFSGGVLQLKVMLNLATEEEKRAFAELNAATEIQTQAMKNLGFVGIKAFMLTDEELKQLNDEIIRLGKESEHSGEILNKSIKEPMSDLESFNTALQEMRNIQASINPHIQKFQAFWNQTKPPIADANKLIKMFVSGLELAPPLAAELEDDLQEWVQSLSKADKEATKVLTKFEQMALNVENVNARLAANQGRQIMLDPTALFGEGIGAMLQKKEDEIKGFTDSAKFLFDMFNNSVASGSKLTADQFIDSWKSLPPEIRAIFLDMVADVENANTEVIEMFSDFESEAQNAYNTAAASASKYIDVTGLMTPQLEGINAQLGDSVVRIEDQANAIMDNDSMWQRLTADTIKQTNANFDVIASWATTNDMLAENLEWQFKVKDAYVQGMVAAKEWTEQTALAAVESEGFRKNLLGLHDVLLKEMDTYNMLTSELQDYITFAMGGRDATIELARASEEARDTMVESFSSLLDTEKFKDFKKEFKELDLRKVFGKEGAGDFKDMFADLRESAKDIEVLQTAMNALGVAVQDIDRMSGKDLAQNFDSFAEAYKKTIAEAGLGNPVIDKMIEDWEKLSGTELRQKLNEIPQTWNMINEAIKTNGISNTEALAIDIMRKKETGEINKLNKEQIAIINQAGFTYDEATGKITKTTDATNHFNSEMSKVEVTAVAVETMNKMWADLSMSIMKANLVLVENWSVTLVTSAEMFADMILNMIEQWGLLIDHLKTKNEEMASHWSEMMNSVIANAESATEKTKAAFTEMNEQLEEEFNAMEENWNNAMTNMVSDAENAASDIESALAGIPDEEVKINFVRTGAVPNAKGGIYSFAEGGLISANKGLYTTNGIANLGPFQFGDNSGGRETVAFLPHDGNKADGIMNQLDMMFGRNKPTTIVTGGSNGDIIVPVTININGEQYSFTRKYRRIQGNDIAQQVF